MGFLDKAKAAANDLAAKADTRLAGAGLGGPGGASSGDADRYFRDLGVLTYLEVTGRPGGAEERERLLAALGEMESRGGIRSFAPQTSSSQAPGHASATDGVGPPPPPGPSGPPPSSPPPPPPPSWMNQGG